MRGEQSRAKLEADGERLVPELQHGEVVHAEHLARYLLASRLAPGRRVLDAACGEGYGTAILAGAGASSAVGVDIDEPTVEHAREHYGIDARVAEVADLPFEDGAFDLVVSFETIEHVEDQEGTLREFARVLSDSGLLLISTPNASESLVENPFHTREYTHDEFVSALERSFPAVRALYQHNWLTSAVLERGALQEASGRTPIDLAVHKTVARDPGQELYTLALCGARVDVEPGQVAVMATVDEAHELAARLVEAERTAELWHGEYAKAEETAKLWERRTHDAVATARWMRGTWSWRLTRPFRAPAKLMRRRGS